MKDRGTDSTYDSATTKRTQWHVDAYNRRVHDTHARHYRREPASESMRVPMCVWQERGASAHVTSSASTASAAAAAAAAVAIIWWCYSDSCAHRLCGTESSGRATRRVAHL